MPSSAAVTVSGLAMAQYSRKDDVPLAPHVALARLANALAFRCPPSMSAYSVGAVVASPKGVVIGIGYSRQGGPQDHAEEVALRAATAGGHDLCGAYVYTSLEPCGVRRSRPRGCAALLIEAGIARVYFTAREPALFQQQTGLKLLRMAGVECIELPEFELCFRRANAHLLRDTVNPGGRLRCSCAHPEACDRHRRCGRGRDTTG